MTISQEAKYYEGVMLGSVAGTGGIVTVVSNLREMWNQAAIASDRLRILIVFAGETVRGPFSRAAATHRVDRQWQAAITRGRGHNADRGRSLTDDVGAAKAFYDECEIYRDAIRSTSAASQEVPIDYKGMEPLTMGSLVIDGYLIKWSTAHDLATFLPLTPTTAPY